MIKLIRPSKIYGQEIIDFKDEFEAYGESVISGSELLDKLPFNEWLNYVQKNSRMETVNDDWVLTDIFFARDEKEIVGVISFRHELNDFLKDWGHIGYSVRPSKRCNGIATWMLSQILCHAQDMEINSLQLSCYDDNLASKKTILNNGGQYLRSFDYLDKKVNIYIININK